MFDTLIMFLNEFFEKVNFEKSQQTTTKACKITKYEHSIFKGTFNIQRSYGLIKHTFLLKF